jgi:WD40 repeat protein/transcriptional regulator with XRE-family HTH domain
VADDLHDRGEEPPEGAEDAADQDEQPDPRRVATQQAFGYELTLARQRAGLTVREVARAAGIPASTAGDYFSGRHLPPPTQPESLPRILTACGVTDPGRRREWVNALARARRAAGRRAAGTTAPYRGLASFEPEDVEWFFGREELTRQLLILATADTGTAGVPLVVIGSSGSGKSSLLRAGLIPGLLAGEAARPVSLFTPGDAPLAELARQLSQLCSAATTSAATTSAATSSATTTTGSGTSAGPTASDTEAALRSDPEGFARLVGHISEAGRVRPVIVVDQFEEVFTACPGEEERREFITALCALSGPVAVAVALRADFYDRALRYPDLSRALQERQFVVGPMTWDQVRRAITEPAGKARLAVDEGLVELLLRDLAPRAGPGNDTDAGPEPGVLPLLSHALLATWHSGSRGSLTVTDYLATGGIRDAIARTAEAAYEKLAEDQRDLARQLFLRLVHAVDGAPVTRSTAALSEWREYSRGAGAADAVLSRFVDQRLITLDSGTVQITHEALITAWPRLRSWIDSDREGLRARRRITEAAQAWEEDGRDSAALLRGGPLVIARDWAADPVNRASLSFLAQEFVDASAAQQKIHHEAERKRTRRLHRLVATLTVAVLATVAAAGYAFQQREVATTARNDADSREVAIEASQIRGQMVSLAAQLSAAAYRIAPTAQARAALLESSGAPAAARLADSSGVVESVSLSPDHRVLAVAGADGTLRLWDVAHPGRPVPLGRPLVAADGSPLYTTAFSPAGRLLAAAGAGGTVHLWNVTDPAHPARIKVPLTGAASTVYSVAFSPSGDVLAGGSADDTVRLWDVAGQGQVQPVAAQPIAAQPVAAQPIAAQPIAAQPIATRPIATLTGAAGYVESVAFSPDGRTLAAGSADKTVRLWDVTDPRHPAPLGRPLTGPAALVTSVTFSPDGTMLAAGSQDDKAWLWNVSNPARPIRAAALTGATDWVNTVAFSPDGTMLAAGSSDDHVLVWHLASRALAASLPHPQPVTSLAWDGAGRLITGDADGNVRNWTLPTPVLLAGGPVNSVAFSPGGGMLAVGSQELELWNPARRTMTAAAPVPGTFVNAVAFQPGALAPGGRLLAAGYGDGMVQLWHVAGDGAATALGQPMPASAAGLAEFVTFSRNGRLLASGGDDGTVRIWSVSDPARPRLLAVLHDSGTYVFSVAFSPDGRVLAAASADNLTRLWDIASPARPARLGRPLSGPTSYAISVAFSPDGRTLAVGSADRTVRLWNVSNPARPAPLGTPMTGPAGYVYSVAFSGSGQTLAAGATDGTVWLWNVADRATPALIAELTGPASQVYSVAFGRGNRTLAAGSADGTVRIWDTSPGAAAAAVCADAGQPLTRREWATDVPGLRYNPPCS